MKPCKPNGTNKSLVNKNSITHTHLRPSLAVVSCLLTPRYHPLWYSLSCVKLDCALVWFAKFGFNIFFYMFFLHVFFRKWFVCEWFLCWKPSLISSNLSACLQSTGRRRRRTHTEMKHVKLKKIEDFRKRKRHTHKHTSLVHIKAWSKRWRWERERKDDNKRKKKSNAKKRWSSKAVGRARGGGVWEGKRVAETESSISDLRESINIFLLRAVGGTRGGWGDGDRTEKRHQSRDMMMMMMGKEVGFGMGLRLVEERERSWNQKKGGDR